jgi:hypothetical protein
MNGFLKKEEADNGTGCHSRELSGLIGMCGAGADGRYNVTPSAAYTYKPAYQRYGHKINAVHFIGPHKPWANLQNRPAGMSLSQQNKQSFDCKCR